MWKVKQVIKGIIDELLEIISINIELENINGALDVN